MGIYDLKRKNQGKLKYNVHNYIIEINIYIYLSIHAVACITANVQHFLVKLVTKRHLYDTVMKNKSPVIYHHNVK